jgi:hypothetical protein
MIINKKEKFIEVIPENGMILTDGNEYFEGLCCPLSVSVEEIYEEITREKYEELQDIMMKLEEENNDAIDHWGDN